jgi:hypothetical protein
MRQRPIGRIVVSMIGILCCVGPAWGDGPAPTNARERFFLKRQNCPWTDAMGKYLMECVRKNAGFNAQGCHNEALDAFCAPDGSPVAPPTSVPSAGKAVDAQSDKSN